MTSNPDNFNDEKIKLVRPPRPGLGLKLVAGLIAVISLFFIIFGGSDSANDDYERSGLDSAGADALVLNGVEFQLPLSQGWELSDSGSQIFIRKFADSRICQVTATVDFNTTEFQEGILGKEAETEALLMEELLGATAPANASVTTVANLLKSEIDGDSFHYAVGTRSTFSMGAEEMRVLAGSNAMFMRGANMVRLQCMNMEGNSDDSGDMRNMALALSIPGI